MTKIHQYAINEHRRGADEAMIFIMPDIIAADGCFKRLKELASSGTRMVLITGLRVVEERGLAAFISEFTDTELPVSIKPRDLVRFGLRFVHPVMSSMHHNSNHFTVWPSNILWSVPGEGFLVRAFHLHPLLIRPRNLNSLPGDSIDGDYVSTACQELSDCHVVSDSDEMVIFSFTPEAYEDNVPKNNGELIPNTLSSRAVGNWIGKSCNRHHQHFSSFKIRVHSGRKSWRWLFVDFHSDIVITVCKAYFLLLLLLDKAPSNRQMSWDKLKNIGYFIANLADQGFAWTYHIYSKVRSLLK